MTKRGLYIVIEGSEGVGKTTQVELLADKLRQQGRMVRIAREPDSQTELTARAIRHLTQDPRYPMNTKTEVLLYNAARSQSLQVVRKSIEAGIDCIVDRSYLTNLAVQYYGRNDIKDYVTINRIIHFAVDDMYPDVMLVLDAPIDTLMERFKKRYHGERFDNLDKSFIERVRKGYLLEAANRAIPVLDALKSPEKLSYEILTHVTYARKAAIDKPPIDQSEKTITSEKTKIVDDANAYKPISVIALAQYLEDSHYGRPIETSFSEPFSYYRPQEFGKKVLGAYDVIVKKLINNYKQATAEYSKYLATQSLRNQKPFKVAKLKKESEAICRNLLPTCIMLNLDSAESKRPDIKELKPATINDDIAALLPNIDAEQPSPGIQLISHSPINEFAVLESFIYTESDNSESAVKRFTDELNYEQKSKLLNKISMSNSETSSLKSINYSWEIVSEYSQYFDLLTQVNFENITIQKPTPRYGYEIPTQIEEAGLGDIFQQSYDLSLELYSLLQAAGFESQASYAALLGHRARYKITLNYSELKRLSSIKATSSLKTILKDAKLQASEVHPILWQRN